jgi:ribosomal protein L7/L12
MDGEAFKLITKEGGKGGNVEIHHRVKSQSEVKAGELTESRSASGGKDKNLGCQLNSPKASDKYDAKREAAKSRSAYLMNNVVEMTVWCNEKLGINTPEAVALVRAFDAAKKSPLSTKAEKAEKKILQISEKIARTEQGQRKIAVVKIWKSIVEQGYSRGQPTWEKAHEALQTADDAVKSSPLGARLEIAKLDVFDTRMDANKSKEMGTVMEAFMRYNCAERARISTASPEEQTKLMKDKENCFKAWGEQWMRGKMSGPNYPF